MKSLFKRLDTSGHFPDLWHTAKGQRDNKKIRAMKERRMLKDTERFTRGDVNVLQGKMEQTYKNPCK